jgi:predicted transcriptional regulator
METDKIHERVIEIQNNIQTSSPEQQAAMMSELINMVSKIEQSLSDIKLDIDDIENQIQTNEE